MEVLNFLTDGVAVVGVGVEQNSAQQIVRLPYPIRILKIVQPLVVVANDADWQLWVNYKYTGQFFPAEIINPINDGGAKLGPKGITIRPMAAIQMNWLGQAVAQVNVCSVYYEKISR